MSCFRRLWLAQTVSVAGDLVAIFAVQVAVTFRMHGTARDLAGVFIAGLIPGILLGPFSGMIADRNNPKRIMIASDLARAVLVLLLPWARSVHAIWGISAAMGCLSSLFLPAQAITLPLVVPRERLFAATARMQQTMQIVRLSGPGIAGAIVTGWGERGCYYADAASFVFSAVLLATLRYQRSAAVGSAVPLAAGIQLLLRDPRFSRVVWPLAAATFAASCFAALASVYVRDLLHRGPSTLAAIGMLIAAGTATGSFVLARCRTGDVRRLIPRGIAGVGAAILLFSASLTPAAALLGAAGMGLSVAMVMAAATALLLGETPPALRGSVSGAAASLTAFAQLSGMVLAGNLAGWIGVRGVFLLSASLLLATAAVLKLSSTIERTPTGGDAPEVVDLTKMVVEMPVQMNKVLRGGKRAAEDDLREGAA